VNKISLGEHDILSLLKPDAPWGALVYFILFVVAALMISRGLPAAVHAAMTRKGHIDRTTISFLQQLGSALLSALPAQFMQAKVGAVANELPAFNSS
jgi:hypothetical protein